MTQTHGVDTCSELPQETCRIGFLFLVLAFGFIITVSEALAFPVSPSTLNYSASSGSPTPSAQTGNVQQRLLMVSPELDSLRQYSMDHGEPVEWNHCERKGSDNSQCERVRPGGRYLQRYCQYRHRGAK